MLKCHLEKFKDRYFVETFLNNRYWLHSFQAESDARRWIEVVMLCGA